MNKWTMWVTGSGLSLLFVAIAVALAHRDSRNQIDPVETTPTVEAPAASPVTLAWQSPSAPRSNDSGPIEPADNTPETPHDFMPAKPRSSLPTFTHAANEKNSEVDMAPANSTAIESLKPDAAPSIQSDVGANEFVQLASFQETDNEVVRGNDETPATGQPTPATTPAPPVMSPFPFTKQPTPATPPNTLSSGSSANTLPTGDAAPSGNTPPIAEMAQLPTLPQAIQNTQDGLKKVADSAAEAATEVGQALDPRRLIGGNAPTAPRSLMPAPTGSVPLGLPTNLPPANAPPAATNGVPSAFPGSPNNANALRDPALNAPPVATFGSGAPPTNRSISSSLPNNSSLPANSSRADNSASGFSSGRPYATSTYSLASADPGERTIEGPQMPALQLIKRAPEEVRVGRNATFTMIVKNTGTAIARQVQVTDAVPNGTRFVAAQPAIQPDNNGELVWELGDLPPGNERVIQLQLIPDSEGEIGSVASVTFASLTSVRTLATQPKITLTHNVAEQVLLSKSFAVQLKITNEGTGVAESVSLEADLPANLKCAAGSQIVADIDRLQPGETKVVDLPLQAIEPGQAQIQLRVVSEDEEVTQQDVSLLVTAPELKVAIQGPTKRYIERQARYLMKVENIGNASATNLDLIAQLPKGFRFNGTGQKGQYDASRHAVLWSLEELPAGIAAEVELDIIPVDMGAQPLLFQAAADLNAQAKTESTVNVEGLSELSFTIADDNDPVEVEGETNYSIKVTNNGTRPDAQVQLIVELPRGATLVGQPDAPVQSTLNGNQIIFSPLAAMKAKETVEYQFTIRWTEEGQQNVRALVTSQNRSVPVTKEEGIEVYRDR